MLVDEIKPIVIYIQLKKYFIL